MTPELHYDVVIIGAGPAGSAAAKVLSDRGLSILAVDFRERPRYKACGGLISQRCRELIVNTFKADIPEGLLCEVPEVKTWFSRNGSFFLPLYETSWQSVDRRNFDWWLNSFYEQSIIKALYVNHRTREDDLIETTLLYEGEYRTVTSRYLIGADGGNSRVRKTVDNRFAREEKFLYLQELFEAETSLDRSGYYFLTGSRFTDLLAAFTVKNGLLYAGTTFLASRKGSLFQNAVLECIRSNFGLEITRRVRAEGCAFALSPFRKMLNPGSGSTLFAGEAAGLISAFGEGIPSALFSGAAAADAIINALDKKGINAVSTYRDMLDPELQMIKKSMGQIRM